MPWDEFVGNADVKAQVSAWNTQQRFPHAILIEGPHGSGRRTLARLIARIAVCEDPVLRPCGRCSACLKAQHGKHPDIRELGGDGNARSFHIDWIRTVREEAYILPNEAPHKVFILAEAQNMTDRAQNALLKVLEEPPAKAMFLLTCESRSQLLSTIQSRTTCLSLGAVGTEDALPLLQSRFPDKTDAELTMALSVYGGILGQTIAGLEDGVFREIRDLTARIAAAISSPEEMTLLKLTSSLAKDKTLLNTVLSGLSLLARDALILRYHADGTALSADRDTALALSRRLTAQQLMALSRQLEQLANMRLHNMNPTLFATVMCVRLRQAAGH